MLYPHYGSRYLPSRREELAYMGGKGSGRYPRKKGSPRQTPMTQAHDPANVNPTVNSKIIAFGKELLAFDEPDYSDADAVWERFCEYLDLCDRHHVKPMVSSMAQAFCMDRRVLWGIATGNDHYKHWKGITPASVDVIKKAYVFLQTNLEISLMEETKNPVKWIFLAKNYFGYEDQTVRVERQESEVTLLPSPEEVAAKYALQVGRPQEPLLVEAEVIDVTNDSGDGS